MHLRGRVFPPLWAVVQLVPGPSIAIREQECVAAATSIAVPGGSRPVAVLCLPFCGCSLDIYGRKCHHTNVYHFHLSSFIFLLTTFRFFRTLTPFPSTRPRCFSLGQSLASPGFESNLCKERRQEKMTQGSFQVRCPGFHYFIIFKVRDRATAPHRALGPLTASWSVL